MAPILLPSNPIVGQAEPAKAAERPNVRIKNRRRRYLTLHPEYITSSQRELADPLLYDRLIRRFQTPSEREAEGRRKGYSGTLEADLMRGEAKLEDALLRRSQQENWKTSRNGETNHQWLREGSAEGEKEDLGPEDREEGYSMWKAGVERRFVMGEDEEFDYALVDEGEEFDDRGVEEREAQERWFEQEEAGDMEFVGDRASGLEEGRKLEGETGIQDF